MSEMSSASLRRESEESRKISNPVLCVCTVLPTFTVNGEKTMRASQTHDNKCYYYIVFVRTCRLCPTYSAFMYIGCLSVGNRNRGRRSSLNTAFLVILLKSRPNSEVYFSLLKITLL